MSQLGNLTLTRFFTIHGFILPGSMILLVVVHLYLFRRHGLHFGEEGAVRQARKRQGEAPAEQRRSAYHLYPPASQCRPQSELVRGATPLPHSVCLLSDG